MHINAKDPAKTVQIGDNLNPCKDRWTKREGVNWAFFKI
jgi:hypothetical protein